jgi:hypothetical protein
MSRSACREQKRAIDLARESSGAGMAQVFGAG